jgi:transketolase
VSMPCWALFEEQPKSYRDAVLPPSVRARIAVEQASSLGWDRYVGPEGATLTMNTFGASAPFAKLQERFGFTVGNLVKMARQVMAAERT